MGAFQWIVVTFTVINGMGVPVLIWVLTQARADRKAKFEEMHERLTHLDTCLDDVRNVVIGSGVTRADLVAFKADITEIISRQRLAISAETTGLHDRIMRVENYFFAQRGGSE
jgi:ferritin-like protein